MMCWHIVQINFYGRYSEEGGFDWEVGVGKVVWVWVFCFVLFFFVGEYRGLTVIILVYVCFCSLFLPFLHQHLKFTELCT